MAKKYQSPEIDNLTNMNHDHTDAAGGGNIPIEAVTDLQDFIDTAVVTDALGNLTLTGYLESIDRSDTYDIGGGNVMSMPTYGGRALYNISGATSGITLNFGASYPTTNESRLHIVKNNDGAERIIVFPTSNITIESITYVFYKDANDITIPAGETAEIHFVFHKADATNFMIRISTVNFPYVSS